MRKESKKLWGLCAIALAAVLAIAGILIYTTRLDTQQNEVLAELARNEGRYDAQSIVLYDTTRAKATELAQLYDAELRITQDGSFARLILPEGTTIRDVYSREESLPHISQMSADYQVHVSDLEQDTLRQPIRPSRGFGDSGYAQQTYLDYLNIGSVWSDRWGHGITVAIIDTGIDTDHPEFAGRISEYSYNATEDKVVATYGDWSLIEDTQGHGTAVAGVLAAGADGEGTVGIAPGVNILVIKAECDASGTFARTSDLVFGLYYAIECNAQVVNMSFGVEAEENPFADATQLAWDSDILCVAAAGNSGTAASTWPAADEKVIGVGAIDSAWQLERYSNFGENTDLVAPGSAYTTSIGGYATASGTSLSAPMVTGAIALLMQGYHYTTSQEITDYLYASCYDLGIPGRDWEYGFGALDISALVLGEKGTVHFDVLTDEIDDLTGVFIHGHTLQVLPTPERLYAVFDGWYYDETFTQEYICGEDILYCQSWSNDVTLYAKWVNEEDGVPFTYVPLEDSTIEITGYTGRRHYITVPEMIDGMTVSSIGNYAFSNQQKLRQITLPAGLKRIGDYAFQNCTNLTAIQIPEGVTTIGDYAFSSNLRLGSVAFDGSSALRSIGQYAFSQCARLKRIELPAALAEMDGTVFYGSTSLHSITVQPGSTVFSARDGVLFDAAGSTLVAFPAAWGSTYTLPEKVTAIGNSAFAYARLQAIDFSHVTSIGDSAFAHASLQTLTIPDTVTILGSGAFQESALSQVTLGHGISQISGNCFAGCRALKQIQIPNSVISIGAYAFSTSGLEQIHLEDGNALTYIGDYAFYGCALSQFPFPASLTSIGSYAFSGFSVGNPLSALEFPENTSLRSIGEGAFDKCWLLKSIQLPGSLQTIGNFAFRSTAPESVTIPAGVTSLGSGAFASCRKLAAITIAEGNTVYHDLNGVVYSLDNTVLYAFPGAHPETEYEINAATTTIAPWAFAGAGALWQPTLPEGLEQISEYAFAYCGNMRTIHIPDEVLQIGRYAFSGTAGLESITFNETAKLPRISFGAFAHSGITSFRVPASVFSIAQKAFEGCTRLRTLTFAENSLLESIPAYMLTGCEKLQKITFERNSALKHIQAHGFEGLQWLQTLDLCNTRLEEADNFSFRFCKNLREVLFPDTLRSIGRYAFYGCASMHELTVPASLEHIGSFAFLGTFKLNLYMQSQALPQYLDENWDYSIAGYYTGVTSVEENEQYRFARLTDGGIAILRYLDSDPIVDLTKADLGGSITVIGGGAFRDLPVTTVILPDTLQQIQAEAFAFTQLENVAIPANVTFIGREAFAHTPIQSLTFGEGSRLAVVEQYAFSGAKQLHSVTLPASLTTLGTGVFMDSGLESITFPENIALAQIPCWAFANTNLARVDLPDSVILVNDNAFRDITTLKAVTFGTNDGIRLMSNAFYGTGLEALHIPANVTYIGEYCFVALRQLQAFTVSADNPNYAAIDGLLVSKDGRKLIAVPAGRTGELTVPSEIEEIGFGAFESSNLSRVSFPEDGNILSIGYRAFFGANRITEMTIPASVVAIDYYAFAYCENLREVSFAPGSQLKGIYEGAFYGDGNLETILLPDTVMEIAEWSFYGCKKLTQLPFSNSAAITGIYDHAFAHSGITGDLTLPGTLLDIGSYAFQGIPAATITVANDQIQDLLIGIGAFEDCDQLTHITLPFIGASCDDMEIGWFGYVFGAGDPAANETYVPDSLQTVTITEGQSILPQQAFACITTIRQLDLPHSIREIYSLAMQDFTGSYRLTNTVTTIDYVYYTNSYSYCAKSGHFGTGLTGEVTLSNDVTELENAFLYCSQLTRVNLPENLQVIGGAAFAHTGLESITIPSSVHTIEDLVFYQCRNLRSITIPDTVRSIGSSCFQECENLETVILPQWLTEIPDNAFDSCYKLQNVTIPYGVTRIGNYAFSACKALTQISLPGSVTEVGNGAFASCKHVTSIALQEGLSIIGQGAFASLPAVSTVTIPSTVTAIDEGAFYNCTGLYHVVNNSALDLTFGGTDHGYLACYAKTIIGSDGTQYTRQEADGSCYIQTPDDFVFRRKGSFYTLVAYIGSNETVTLPSDIDGNSYNIAEFRGGTHIILPDGWKTVPENAFYGSSVHSVTLPDSVTSIGAFAFANCENLETVNIPESVTSIGMAAFAYGGLKSVVIPSGVRTLDTHTFADCENLTSVTLSENLYYIGNGAFRNCSALTEIQLPDTLTNIDDAAFLGCFGLTSLDLPDGLLRIGNYAFGGCNGLEEVTVPDSVTRFGYDVFENCTALKRLTLGTGITDFEGGSISGNRALEEVIFRNGLYVQEGPFLLTQDKKTLVYAMPSISGSVAVPDGVEIIGESAFENCQNVTDILIPSGVTEIGSDAFYNCPALKTVSLPNTLRSLGQHNTFAYCSSLESVTIPAGVTEIPNSAFSRCTALTHVTLPEGITRIGNNAFDSCENLQALIVPTGVTEIGDCAFRGCGSLTSVLLPATVQYIGASAFQDCYSLEEIGSLDGIIRIGDNAFEDVRLHTLSLPATLESLGSGALQNMWALERIDVAAGNPVYASQSGILYDVATGQILHIPSWISGYITLREGLTTITADQFQWNDRLTGITIPSTVTFIEDHAFRGCSSLLVVENHSSLPLTIGASDYGGVAYYARELIHPDGSHSYRDSGLDLSYVETEDGFLFRLEDGVYTLIDYSGSGDTVILPSDINGNPYNIDRFYSWGRKHLIIPEGFSSIQNAAFSDSPVLETVVIADSVSTIGYHAFGNCTKLHTVHFGTGLTTIDYGAFYGCTSLASVDLPDGLATLYYGAFEESLLAKDPANWRGGVLVIDGWICQILPEVTYITGLMDLRPAAELPIWNCQHLKHFITAPTVNINNLTNLETLILQGRHYIPDTLTLQNIVLTDDWTIGDYQEYLPYLFRYITGVTIYLESPENDLRLDDNFPGWNYGNRVYYGGEWAWSNFYDENGVLISSTPRLVSEVIRRPAMSDYTQDGLLYVFVGWDLDGDGIADQFPATCHTDVNATAVYEARCDHDLVQHEAKAPSCEEAGWDAYEECTKCGHSTYHEIPAIGHRYETVVVEPTCTAGGYTAHTCANCGDHYTTDHTDALGHIGTGDTCERCGASLGLLGDANGDGRVNNVDAMLILQYAVGVIDESRLTVELCDVNGDGRVNNVDAMLVLQYAVGVITKFPIE